MGLLSALGGMGGGALGGSGGMESGMFGLLPMLLQQQQGNQQSVAPPPQQPNDLASAFANSPQFMQQLQAMQNGMGPGRQAPTFTPPPMQMSTAPLGGSPNGRNSTIPADLGLRGLGMLRGNVF